MTEDVYLFKNKIWYKKILYCCTKMRFTVYFSYMRHAYGLGEHYNSVEPLKDLANEEEGWPITDTH